MSFIDLNERNISLKSSKNEEGSVVFVWPLSGRRFVWCDSVCVYVDIVHS